MERGIFRGELDDEQRSVFAHIFDGKTGRETATSLGETPARIEAIIRKTCRQLGVSSRHETARILANHYGWKPGSPLHPVQIAGRMDDHQDGTKSGVYSTRMAQTKREHSPRSAYVRNVGHQVLDKDEDTGVYSEVAEQIKISNIIAASSTMQRVLLMALLIASSALALSALISAMQGFDTLFFS